MVQGCAVFELDGERRNAPAGTFVEHLRRGIELSDRFRSYANGDSDFDPIRDEAAFKELVAE